MQKGLSDIYCGVPAGFLFLQKKISGLSYISKLTDSKKM